MYLSHFRGALDLQGLNHRKQLAPHMCLKNLKVQHSLICHNFMLSSWSTCHFSGCSAARLPWKFLRGIGKYVLFINCNLIAPKWVYWNWHKKRFYNSALVVRKNPKRRNLPIKNSERLGNLAKSSNNFFAFRGVNRCRVRSMAALLTSINTV